MHFVYHIGLHCTDEDMALRCLLRNSNELAAQGCIVSPPGRYKPVLREAMIELRGRPSDSALQAQMKTAILDKAEADMIVFSNDNFVCPPARAVIEGELYPLAAERLPWIRNLFPADTAEFCFGMRNPVTLLPALHQRFAKGEAFADYLARVDLDRLSWAVAVERMRAAVPDAKMTLWCNEDTPLIWPEVLGALSGSDEPEKMKGVNDLVGSIMSPTGLSRFTAYLSTNPPQNAEHRRKVTAAFLAKFALPDAVEVEVEGDDWTEDHVAAITARYEADIARIAEMDGIMLLRA